MATAAKGTLYTFTASALNVAYLMDVGEDISTVGVQVTSPGVATISYEVSSDNINWTPVFGVDIGSSSFPLASSTTTAGARIFPVQGFKWFRLRTSAYTSGTVTAYAITDTASIGLVPTVGGVFGTANTVTNGATIHRLIGTASVNNTLVKASAGKLVGGQISNSTATIEYIKFYNKATAPVAGTDVPVLTLAVPANACIDLGSIFGVYGVSFTTGIGFAVTGLSPDTDTTAITAGGVVVNLLFA
jgi:hypothetical protein